MLLDFNWSEIMIGTQIRKPIDYTKYAEAADWANKNNARIVDYGDYYEVQAVPPKTVEELKITKLSEINSAYDVSTSGLVATYPQTELLTFDKQESEARAWLAASSVETPLIDTLAAGRGMDKAELVSRIITKADAFAVTTGYLTGQRQRYEDQLDAATTAEEVEAIVPEYVMPEGLTI